LPVRSRQAVSDQEDLDGDPARGRTRRCNADVATIKAVGELPSGREHPSATKGSPKVGGSDFIEPDGIVGIAEITVLVETSHRQRAFGMTTKVNDTDLDRAIVERSHSYSRVDVGLERGNALSSRVCGTKADRLVHDQDDS